jgi:hypothetical protein
MARFGASDDPKTPYPPVHLTEELLAEARLGDGLARKLYADLAYRSGELKEALIEDGIQALHLGSPSD